MRSSSAISEDLMRKILSVVGYDWVSIEEIKNELGIEVTLDILNRLSRSRLLEVMYNTLDGTFYLRRRRVPGDVNNEDAGNEGDGGGRKLNLQKVVERLRSEIKGVVPKPEIEEWLSSNVNGNWRLVYNQLLNDGVIEEVVMKGMVFVKVVNE